MLQEELIATVRKLCAGDPALAAALMYGSFAKGEADRFSDIEFWCFFDSLPDPREWISRVAPLRGLVRNEYGTDVAVFRNGVRGEFHLRPEAEIESVRSWTGELGGMEVVVDRDGRLAEALAQSDRDYRPPDRPARLQALCDGLIHHLLLGSAVLERGELARALDALSNVQRYLLWMLRVVEGRAEPHRPTPSRAFESEISAAGQARYARCTAALDAARLRDAYAEARSWGIELMDCLGERDGVESRSELL